MKILLSAWMKELDRLAMQTAAIPSISLMENAAQAASAYFAAEFPPTASRIASSCQARATMAETVWPSAACCWNGVMG